MGKSEYAMNHP